jgi:hypothetical protein
VLVGGEGLDDRFGMARGCLGDGLGELFLNAACSSGVAARACRGRGRCSVYSTALSASQPRCSATWARPRTAAMKAAAFFAVQTPPSSGGVPSRSRTRASTSGVRIVGGAPLPRRRSPRLVGPKALYRASSCSIQRRANPVSPAVSATVRPCASSQITWKCRAVVASPLERYPACSSSMLRCPATCARPAPVLVVEQSLPHPIPSEPESKVHET